MSKALRLIVVLLTLAVAAPSHALPVTEVDYLHCDPATYTPLGNINTLTDILDGTDTRPHWSPTPPTGPGCEIFVSPSLKGNGVGINIQNVYGFMASGGFSGDLDAMTISLYAVFAGEALQGGKAKLYIHLAIDGQGMWGLNSSSLPAFKTVDVTPQPTSTPNVYRFDYSITGLGFTTDDAAQHEVEIAANIGSELASVFPIDSTYAPSGITFNPETLAEASVAATTPGPVE